METIEFLDPKTGIVGEKPAANGDNDPRPTSDPEDGESSEQDDQPLPAKIARSPTGVESEPHVKASEDDDNVNDQASTSSAAGDDEEPTSSSHNRKAQPHRTMEPLEVETITTEDVTEDELYDDMESLLHSEEDGATTKSKSKKTASGGALRMKSKQTYCCGKIQPHPVGNMTILFPDRFERMGWGVVGPHWFGPACVWLILAVATRFTIKGALTIGPISTLICIGFMGYCSYLLANVSFRDPGICLSQEIPNDVPEDQRRQWRWCDFCSAYQPPDGAHCPDCNVCVAGYDHHCVWMGTCIGKRNYRQFVKFNMMWLYYLLYAIFWLSILGPMFFHEHHYKGAMKHHQQNHTEGTADGGK